MSAATQPLRIYIAGPMTGLPEFNYPAFNAEARVWRVRGFEVENPAEGPDLPSWAAYMRRALRQLLTCDAICLLPGWTHSKGATVEWLLSCVLGLQMVYHEPPSRLQQRLMRVVVGWMPSGRGPAPKACPGCAHALLQRSESALLLSCGIDDPSFGVELCAADQAVVADLQRVAELVNGGAA